MERMMSILIENFAGAFPVWLAPTQVQIITVSDNNNDYAREVQAKLQAKGVRVEVDLSNESVGKKIRNAVMTKSPYVLVLGDKEMAEGTVAVRARGNKDTVSMSYADFEAELMEKIDKKSL